MDKLELPYKIRRLRDPEVTSIGVLCKCSNMLKTGGVSVIMRHLRRYLNSEFNNLNSSKKLWLSDYYDYIEDILSEAVDNDEKLLHCQSCNKVYYNEERFRDSYRIIIPILKPETNLEPAIIKEPIDDFLDDIIVKRDFMNGLK